AGQRRHGSKPHVRPGQTQDDNGCRQEECGPCDEESGCAATDLSEVDCQLRGTWPGQQAHCPNKIEKAFAAHPSAAPHKLLFHQGDVRCRPSKRNETQPQEHARDLSKSARRVQLTFTLRVHCRAGLCLIIGASKIVPRKLGCSADYSNRAHSAYTVDLSAAKSH